ncbi:winged helix-turn-helix transcriptional regulator [Candidatus Roizmanbacteria bacterium]|nr:winged helix-turn-helix transcriptional regulator [Candidatus Roizmanbacteria bacterium]
MINRSYIIGHNGHPHFLTDKDILSLKQKAKLSRDEKELLKIMKHLSDPTKLRIYLLLHTVDEIAVSDVAQILGLAHSTVSHALADLKLLGLAQSHRCGLLICYSLSNTEKRTMFISFFNRFKKQ